MDDLIAALTILRKYGNERFPTLCEHDYFSVAISPEMVNADDIVALEKLDFFPSDCDTFYSDRFGSC